MDSKLTIKLDADVIDKAKRLSKKRNTSLSRIIESYLRALVSSTESPEVSELVKSISGISNKNVTQSEKTIYKKHLANKYGH